MRLVLAIIGMLFSATTVNAQEAAEAKPLGWHLCDAAFSAATGGAAPGATPAPSASPAPAADPTFLDDAIRMCPSIGEFAAAALRYPELIAGVDVLSLVTARCDDATTGLSGYATCNSLRRALASPTPSPVAEAIPSPAPSATPTATPRPTPRPAKRPRPTARPTAQPSRTAIQPGATTAQVPSGRTPVRGATRVHYFEVVGATPRALLRSVARQAGRYCGLHAVACVQARRSVAPTYIVDPATGSCRITGLRMRVSYVAHMPRWTAPRRVPAYLAWWWRKDAARTGWHEAQHIRIGKRHDATLRALVVGKPCFRYGRLVRQWSRSLDRAQDAFDRRDYRRHAQASSRWWQQALERFPPYP